MSKIDKIELYFVDLKPKVLRTDAIQSFVSQETPIVKIFCDDGSYGIGYTYTIGTGGHSIVELLTRSLFPVLLNQDPDNIEYIWKKLLFHTHATHVGAITSLSLCAIDTALWDRKSRIAKLPLNKLAGGAQTKIPVYTTEGGWLNLSEEQLVMDAINSKKNDFKGCKVKIGKPSISEDVKRIAAIRKAVGDDFEIMVDANQAFNVDQAIQRAHALEPYNIAWLEEPLPAEDLNGHIRLSSATTIPIAVGESIYSPTHFKEYLHHNACSVVQVDVARIGGITPWLKTAHLAETYNIAVCPHFLMELHVSLCGAIPNARWIEYIPQLDSITHSHIHIKNGYAYPSTSLGLGIDWNWEKIKPNKIM